ncbi:MAG: CPBP family intramembrane metalloprotease [Candidatus Sumerlaeaceae bacterium]|nr:CPBP family intramembrane metalloprotease [Candidatus Sumerlaeaceae bacterium]
MLFQAIVLLICVLAAADFMRLANRQKRSRLQKKLYDTPLRGALATLMRATTPWVKLWFFFQAISLAGLFGSGNSDRALGPVILYLTNAFFLILLAPVGVAMGASAGTPNFLLHGFRRITGKLAVTRVVVVVAALGVNVLFTYLLFSRTSWGASESLKQALRPEAYSSPANLVFAGYLLISAAVMEEMLFRHYLLNRLLVTIGRIFPGRKDRQTIRKDWVHKIVAVLITTIIFALGHRSVVSPDWLKYTQTGVLGLTLGVCQLTSGTASCVALHLLFNFSMVFMARLLV